MQVRHSIRVLISSLVASLAVALLSSCGGGKHSATAPVIPQTQSLYVTSRNDNVVKIYPTNASSNKKVECRNTSIPAT